MSMLKGLWKKLILILLGDFQGSCLMEEITADMVETAKEPDLEACMMHLEDIW
jgi:hypothetical protein